MVRKKRSYYLPLFIPRPPEITIEAEVKSGRADLLTFSETKDDNPASQSSLDNETASVVADPPSVAALSNPVERVKINLTGSSICTVAIALPA